MSLLTLSLLVLCSLNQAASEVYYITTNSTDLRTVQPYLTLSLFATNSSHYLHSNTTLVFLPGIHHLSNVNLTLSNVDNFVMKSENSTAQIKCTNNSSIRFNQSQSIHITNLEFIGCGGNQVRHVEKFMVKDSNFVGQENSETALELIETIAQIVNSTFLSNRKGLFRECAISFDPEYGCKFDGFIGGAIIATNSTVNISRSKFEDNRADTGGAIFAEQDSIINMSGNMFVSNNVAMWGGVLDSFSSTITIEASEFHDNYAIYKGGVLYSYFSSAIIIKASKFHDNSASDEGGVLYSKYSSNIIIEASKFYNNNATKMGGVLSSSQSAITIEASEFHNNNAEDGGIILASYSRIIIIEASEFHDNNATELGGVLSSSHSIIKIEASEFHGNNANNWGGVLASIDSIIIIAGSNFTNNVSPIGAVIYAISRSMIRHIHSFLLVDNNMADRYAVIFISDSEFIGHAGNATFSSNLGSLVAFNSNITFTGYATFVNNTPSQTVSDDFQEGGAITLFHSNVFFDGECNLEHNHAKNGGAVHSTESKLYVNGDVTIAQNTATGNGGGVYLSTSELNCQQKSIFVLWNNTASHKGGGLHAISSSIKAFSSSSTYAYIVNTGTRIKITGNTAERGGGLSLEANAKLYILDNTDLYTIYANTTTFAANSADYGGAIHVDDDTNSGTCNNTETECFFQVLALRSDKDPITQSMYFSQNHANISGSTLYGGLLDRCAVSPFAEIHGKYPHAFKDRGNGIAYFKNVSTPKYPIYNYSLGDFMEIVIDTNLSVSSDPVRVCLCFNADQNNDCTHQHYTEIKKGQTFTLPVVAVDQVGQPVSAIIQTSLHFTESGLAEGQLARKIPAKCANLTFNVVSPHKSENLSLYASDGPCKDAEFSRATVEIHFLPCRCPIGLQASESNSSTNCTCDCHHNISRYMEHCDSHDGSLVKKPQTRAWISYINDTDLSGYLVYPNCPFDYCLSTSPPLYLNQSEGADAQCDFDRSSLLCGSCQSGLSLSLGSSHCLSCPSHWPALLIAFTIAAILVGITLVALLLILNLTVAVGTLNGIIFYANIVHANKSILLPFQESSLVTVFISMLNLELGIDTCYFPGMDTYIKTWLKLAFPAFVFLLVGLIIIISSYSIKFSKLIGNKDPVATLATLILLSYAKILETCFESLSIGILSYPDGSREMVWLPDATIQYLHGKHIPLFIASVLILLVGLIYTLLLFSWQWYFYLPQWKIIQVCLSEQRLKLFIETYHAPCTLKHRYWTGLLLTTRAILYIVATANVSNDPQIALSAIVFTMIFILFLVAFIDIRMYKRIPLSVLDTFFILNILLFSVFTWYSLSGTNINQQAVAYTSVLATFTVLWLIVFYHVYAYTKFSSKLKSKMINGNILRFKDYLLNMFTRPSNTYEYNLLLVEEQPATEPTYSVVELPKPQHPDQPVPEEAIIYNYVPSVPIEPVEPTQSVHARNTCISSADQHEVESHL